MMYVEITDKMKYYLEIYPCVKTALQCVAEDVEQENDTKKLIEVNAAIDKIDSGENDFDVIRNWGEEVGARDLTVLGNKIEEARRKKKDIGFYVRKYNPEKDQNVKNGQYKGKRK